MFGFTPASVLSRLLSTIASVFLLLSTVWSQYPGYQQSADYTMNIAMDTALHQYRGEMTVVLENNSPDALKRSYFHLFFNAFQPGSMMDIRSQNIVDPDSRVGNRIGELPEDEWGWIRVEDLQVNGSPVQFQHDGTILDVVLNKAIQPGKKATYKMTWTAQVPRQIRRSGWMNKEGIEYSMTQWYPKLCEYDHDGWHTEPYIGREFHGIWSDYDVTIALPPGYVVGGTGELKGSEADAKDSGVWHFKAENVIDFAWAADPDYIHTSKQMDQVMLHFYHQENPEFDTAWEKLPEFAAKAMAFLNDLVGPYPYPQYTVIQGGDGGMEYPMATLVTGNRSNRSLIGVTVHEMAHSWFQATLATNESLFEFLDEGMASYVSSLCMSHLFADPIMGAEPHRSAYSSYMSQALSGQEEPLITHADHYQTNRAYGVAAYSKGEVLLAQLEAIIGRTARDLGLKRYFKEWAFKHPGPNDFKRIMEKTSEINLDWYFQYFVHTTHQIDASIQGISAGNDTLSITLERPGKMPMPVDIQVTYEDGSSDNFHIPLVMMRGHRPLIEEEILLNDWAWTHPSYTFHWPTAKTVKSVHIDPLRITADVNRDNNYIEFDPQKKQQFLRN
jgi:hypothetical protein